LYSIKRIDKKARAENEMKFYINEVDGYIFDKRIFWVVMVFLISGMLTILSVNNWDLSQKYHVKCEGMTKCLNPLYDGAKAVNIFTGKEYPCLEDWCTVKWLEPGEYGQKKPSFIGYFLAMALILPGIGLGFNHFMYNRGKKFVFPSSLSKETREKLKKIVDKLE